MSRTQHRSILSLVAASLLLLGCRDDVQHPPGDDTTGAVQTQPGVIGADSAGGATGGEPSATSAPGAAEASPWTQPATRDPAIARERTAVVDTLDGFLKTIDAGNESAFKAQLATRSVELLRALHAEDEIWPIAREALGSLKDRQLKILGGGTDSVALLVSATRREGDSLLHEDLVMSLLREGGAWKVMYPGAQRLDEHVGP
jgi:hypothetical protein